jgi:UDP-glucose 4-epimerase
LTIVSPGTQVRNFTHVDDIITGLIMVGENGSGDNYGIGCSKSFSILDIANMFNTEIKMLPERKGNRMSAQVVCDKTKQLGWRETHSIKRYIEEIKKENETKD